MNSERIGGNNPSALQFKKGQIIAVLAEDHSEGNLKGRISLKPESGMGWFPNYFVRVLEGDAQPLKCGWLSKRGAKPKKLKIRWFQLEADSETLSYRVSPGERGALTEIGWHKVQSVADGVKDDVVDRI